MILQIDRIQQFSSTLDHFSFPKLKYSFIDKYNEALTTILLDAGDLPFESVKALQDYKEQMDKLFVHHHLDYLSVERKTYAVELAIDSSYNMLDSYFRIFHRIVKYINSNVTDDRVKKEYIGFLRATVNEMEILVLFYNAIYTERGLDLLEELSETNFFGDSDEFEQGKELPFINRESFIWPNQDFEIMKDLPAELARRTNLSIQ